MKKGGKRIPIAKAEVTTSVINDQYYPQIIDAFVSAFSALPEDDKFFQYISKKPWDGMVKLDTQYYFPHTKESKKKNLIFCSVKPDIDNLWKSPMDCLEGEIWTQDSRIFTGTPVKLYDDGDGPRTECRCALYTRC